MVDASDHESLTFTIGPDDVGVRLDAFLASQIAGWSRARLQRLIEAEDVLVNAKPNKPSYKLREHDEVEVELITPATISFIGMVSPGLYQINASVPQGLSPGDQLVVLGLLGGDSAGKQSVTIPIQ